MPAQFTRADALREYLTGAASDGGAQSNPADALGNFRSSTEAVSLGITIANPITGVTVQYAGGANPTGVGTLTAIDSSHLTWQPAGASAPGSPTSFSGSNDVELVESLGLPGQYLRISGTPPFSVGTSQITLATLVDNFFGFDDLTPSQASAGLSEYRATIIRNEASFDVTALQRCLALLGTVQNSDTNYLPVSGAGTIITSGTFVDWPAAGWCQVRDSGGTLKEVVYYTSRTSTTLTVPAAGRALLGTTAQIGSLSDVVYPVPGVAIGLDSAGVQSFGSSIQTIANANTAPTGITWNLEILPGNGLQVASLAVSQQIGIWMWRQVPPGAIATPLAFTQVQTNFNSF